MDKPYKLLIIDDEAEILATFNNFFREKKYDVISASNGLDALKLIESEKEGFDLIVTDLVLPNIGGTAIIKIAGDADYSNDRVGRAPPPGFSPGGAGRPGIKQTL